MGARNGAARHANVLQRVAVDRQQIGEQQTYVQALQTQMAVRHFRGKAMQKTLDWAASELEGFSRN